MTTDLTILLATAATIGFLHTLFGPDHYVPFIAMAKAKEWSKIKTFFITLSSGIGHVLGSVVLGLIGIIAGMSISQIESIESFRGDIAGWLLISFGFVYLIWGIKKAIRNIPHKHIHVHKDGTSHEHLHTHQIEHSHVHDQNNKKSITPWVLFTIFIFGPCEALIPMLMYPAVNESILGLVLVVTVFGIMTIATMIGMVFISLYGINILPLNKLTRYSHAIAGAIIFMSGLSIQVLGL